MAEEMMMYGFLFLDSSIVHINIIIAANDGSKIKTKAIFSLRFFPNVPYKVYMATNTAINDSIMETPFLS